MGKISTSLLCSRINNPTSLGLFSCVRCSNPLVIFMALCCTRSAMSASFLYGGAQNWAQHSSCHFTSTEWKGRISSLYSLTVLFLTQPRMLLATFAARTRCWLMLNLVSTRTCRFFSAKLRSSQSSPNSYWCVGLFLPCTGHCLSLH